MLDEVKSRFSEKCSSMLKLQQMERDSCYNLQKSDWVLRAQVYDREYFGKDIDALPPDSVPKPHIDDFVLFQ